MISIATSAKSFKKHQEGDVWEESGKTWTIKNGIKRTVSKMDQARKEVLLPLACPKCQSSMNHYLDKQMWAIHRSCFNCVIDAEHEIIKAGNWKAYEKQKIESNFKYFAQEMEEVLKDFVQDQQSKHHVTEDGSLENWKGLSDTKVNEIRETISTQISEASQIIKER